MDGAVAELAGTDFGDGHQLRFVRDATDRIVACSRKKKGGDLVVAKIRASHLLAKTGGVLLVHVLRQVKPYIHIYIYICFCTLAPLLYRFSASPAA